MDVVWFKHVLCLPLCVDEFLLPVVGVVFFLCRDSFFDPETAVKYGAVLFLTRLVDPCTFRKGFWIRDLWSSFLLQLPVNK